MLLALTATLQFSQTPPPEKTQNTVPRAGGTLAAADARNRPNVPKNKEVTVSVIQKSNPLQKAAEQISQQLRLPVAFEEPAWVADSDLIRFVDTPEIRASRPPELIARTNPNVRVAAIGSIEAHTILQDGQDQFQIAANLIQDCVSDNAHRGNAGDFKVVKIGNYGFSIVPAQVRGARGQWQSVLSPLDSRISFQTGDRSLGNTLELIAKAISDTTVERVRADISSPGVNSIFSTARTQIGAQNEIARDILGKTFREMSVAFGPTPMMWWNLEYQIDHKSTQAAYVLRFNLVNYTDDDGRFKEVNWPEKPNKK